MEELEKLEAQLNSIYNTLFDAEDPLDMEVLSDKEKEELENKAQQLENKISAIYLLKKKQLEEENTQLLENSEAQKLYDKNAKTNYLICKILTNIPEILLSTYVTAEVEKFIYSTDNYNRRDTNFYRVAERIAELEDIQPIFYHYTKFIKFLNHPDFRYLSPYFKNQTIMNNQRFINYLLKIIKDPDKNIGFEEYHNVTQEMEDALNEGINIDFIYALGNKNRYQNYIRTHSKKFLFRLINRISDQSLKQKIAASIFELKDKKNLYILVKFLEIPEIQQQLLDENSFYYQLLITPLRKDTEEIYDDEDSIENIGQTFFCDEEFASIYEVILFDSDDFYDYKFDKMIHHFDQYVNNYIYFYYENEVKRVPVLFYIQSMKKKIELWMKIMDIFPMFDIPKEMDNYLQNAFSDYIDKDFVELAKESLLENIDKVLTEDEEAYWNYLLEDAKNYQNDEESVTQLELKNTI